jgi:hypothetical protein
VTDFTPRNQPFLHQRILNTNKTFLRENKNIFYVPVRERFLVIQLDAQAFVEKQLRQRQLYC